MTEKSPDLGTEHLVATEEGQKVDLSEQVVGVETINLRSFGMRWQGKQGVQKKWGGERILKKDCDSEGSNRSRASVPRMSNQRQRKLPVTIRMKTNARIRQLNGLPQTSIGVGRASI